MTLRLPAHSIAQPLLVTLYLGRHDVGVRRLEVACHGQDLCMCGLLRVYHRFGNGSSTGKDLQRYYKMRRKFHALLALSRLYLINNGCSPNFSIVQSFSFIDFPLHSDILTHTSIVIVNFYNVRLTKPTLLISRNGWLRRIDWNLFLKLVELCHSI